MYRAMTSLQSRANYMQRVARFSGNPATKKVASRLQSAADKQRKELKRRKREMKLENAKDELE